MPRNFRQYLGKNFRFSSQSHRDFLGFNRIDLVVAKMFDPKVCSVYSTLFIIPQLPLKVFIII